MDINIDKTLKKESLLIRYAGLLFNNKRIQNKSGEELIKTANELKFYAYPTTLMNSSSDPSISDAIKPHLTYKNSEKLILEMNQTDSHFIDSIGVSDIDSNVENIFNAYNNFFNSGNFDKMIRACYRFLKRIKGANEYDMNDIVVRYMISCICMNDYSNCINIIENIGQNYILFDYNIYIFLLYFIQGKYEQACDIILQIKNNISDNLYQLITEKDLAFYFSLCLLYNFKGENYKQVLSNNDSLVYKLYDKYNEYFKIIDEYFKCDYLKVNTDFNNIIKAKIERDPFLSGFSQEIEEKFKKKILKEILSFSSEISFETIKNILLLSKKENALNMVKDLIKNEKINALIDDIEGIVIMKEKSPISEILEKSNEIMKNNLKDLIKYSLNKNIKYKFSAQNFQKMDDIEVKAIGGDARHEIGDGFILRMGKGLKFGGM